MNDKLLIYRAKELIPTLWVEQHAIKSESGTPIEFKDHYFMRDIYDDMSQYQVILKAPQIGATVMQLLKTMWCAAKKGWDIIYTLPTQSDVNDMAGGKINRLIAQNPVLLSWCKDHDTVDQKAVGRNIIYYRGTFTQKQAMMVSSDLNVHDEVDASEPHVILQYETRLQAKSDGRRWYFSHPSIAGFGVDIYWQQSDKKEWQIFCNHCGGKQFLKWPESVDRASKRFKCVICDQTLSDDARRYGVWQATSKGIFSGYHISQLMCAWISAEKIVDDYVHKDAQYFYNYVLGLPYLSSENKIEPEIVLRNVSDEMNLQEEPIIIGVDTGLPIHYVVLNEKGVFYHGTCHEPTDTYDPYDELGALLSRFKEAILVADQGGDLIGIRKLQAKYPARVFLCYYRKDRKANEMIKWGDGNEFGMVIVDRNRMISLMVEQLREGGRINFNGTREEWKDLASHFGNIFRVVKPPEESHYGMEFLWDRSGPDHFVHALLYALTGLDKYGKVMATVMNPNPWGTDLPQGRIFDNSLLTDG